MKKRKAGVLFKLILALFAIFAVGTIINLRLLIDENEAEVRALSAQVEEQTKIKAALKASSESELNDEKTVELARKKLGLVMPGERVYINSND